MRLFYFIFLLFWVTLGKAQSDDLKCHRSTEGKEFWFGFMEGRNDNGNVHYIEITVTAREASSFQIFIGKSITPLPNIANFVNANGSVQIKIPLDLGEARGSETIQEKGIYLVAKNPVNVYALNWDLNSADVAVIYPVPSLGNKYFTMCYTPFVHNSPAHGRNSEFLIVASEDNTTVNITPSVVTDGGKPAGVSFSVILSKGEVYQVQSLNQRNLAGQGDLTGSYIESDKPIAVYSGNFSTTVPAESGMSGYDHLFEQIPPLQSWGREYYAVPLSTRRADRYRVIASEDNTTVLIGNLTTVTLNRGGHYEFLLESNQPSRIFADKPILVAQFSQSNRTDQNFTGGDGDPFMIILSSVSQSKNDVTFVAYNSSQIRDYYVNIVVLTSEKDNIELDGNNVGYFFRPFANSDYSYAQLKIFAGTHTLRNLNPDRGFLAYVYGYGGFESYGYGVGFNLNIELDLSQTIDFEGDTLQICENDKIVLDAGPYFDFYNWNTGDTTQKIIVTKQGKYWAQGTTVDGCTQSDSIYILIEPIKKPDIGPDAAGCALKLLLDAGDGYARYEWSTGETTQTIEAGKTSQYHVTVFDDFGCPARDTMNMTVFQVPVITMIGQELTCGNKFRKLELQFSNANYNMLSNGKIIWNTDQPDKLKITNKTNTSADITVSEWGVYTVSFTFTTPDGCVVSDKYTLRFAEIPTSKIEFADNPDDKCKEYSREIIYMGNASQNANLFWDYGNSLADSIDWNKRRVSVAAGNAKSIISLHVEENGCWSSDTSTLTMGANPDFVMNTAKSRGCDTATVQFSGELKVEDNLLFEWDFGDGSAISNLQTPTHFYSDTGKYNVTLKITNLDNQCFVGYTIEEMVKVFPTPMAKIELDPAFCNDSTANAIYSLNIDSSFCYWKFEGAHQIAGENDSITVFLDKQIATIRLQVEEYGCTSDWTETTARRKPFFDFSTDITHGCQPLQVLATATTADEQLEFSWLTDSIVTTGTEQPFMLPNAGDYGFSLSAKSGITGCSDTISKEEVVTVHPKPFAKFDVDYPVAIIEHATLRFTNLSLDVDIFNWDFGDGTTSAEKNPQHTFVAINKYPVELNVESEFGCRDTAMMEIEILPFNVHTPNAFRPDSDIPENREFMPVGVGIDPNVFQLQIFNRWGELVFESNNPEHKWDGNTKNSNPAPMGNYLWKAEFADIQGFQHSMKGQVLLIR